MSEANKQLALEMLRAMMTNDVPALRRLFHPDVKQWLPQSSVERMGWELPNEGLDHMLEIQAKAEERYESIYFEPDLLLADGDVVGMFGRTYAHHRDGRKFDNRYAFFFRIEDGIATDVWEHPDTARLFRFFDGESFD